MKILKEFPLIADELLQNAQEKYDKIITLKETAISFMAENPQITEAQIQKDVKLNI
jgi:hypothetical protein